MVNILDIQFYRLGRGGTVGDILKVTFLPRDAFADDAASQEWASTQLKGERTSRNLRWPEGVQAVDGQGEQVFNWTFWDEVNAKSRRSPQIDAP